jgi:hypothetical protein
VQISIRAPSIKLALCCKRDHEEGCEIATPRGVLWFAHCAVWFAFYGAILEFSPLTYASAKSWACRDPNCLTSQLYLLQPELSSLWFSSIPEHSQPIPVPSIMLSTIFLNDQILIVAMTSQEVDALYNGCKLIGDFTNFDFPKLPLYHLSNYSIPSTC